MADALGRVELVCNRLVEQFGAQAMASTIDGRFKSILTPTLNTARQWQPPDGRPIPEIDPQDIRSLGWAAAKLFRALGEEPPGPQVGESAPETGAAKRQGAESEEDWQPASKAITIAEQKGYDITLGWISKRKDKNLHWRPRQLPGKHQIEVEMGSLAKALFAEANLKTAETDTDEPDGAERDNIEARKQTEQGRKRRSSG